MIAAFPGDDELLQQVYFTQANLCWSIHKAEEAVEACHQAVAHAAGDKQQVVVIRFRAASFLHESRNFVRLYDEAAALPPLLDGDPREPPMPSGICRKPPGRPAATKSASRRPAVSWPSIRRPPPRTIAPRRRVVECLRKLDRSREVRACYEEWEKKDPDSHWRQRWCFTAAECCLADKDFDPEYRVPAALAAYRRVIAGHCGDNVSDLWYEAQRRIVDLLTNSGDFKAAIQEAHVLFDASQPHTIILDTQRVADLFAKLDQNRDRADRFIAFQHYGPDGPDGRPGSDDDLTNPLDEIGYPADPERKQAFAKVFAHLGNDAAAGYHRGMICVYAGQPRAALYYFMDAFRRSGVGKYQDYAIALVVNGLRPVRGHSVGLDGAAGYILYGPSGNDGAAGATPDPFWAYTSLAPPAPFTVPPPPEQDLQLLKKLHGGLWPRPPTPPGRRASA